MLHLAASCRLRYLQSYYDNLYICTSGLITLGDASLAGSCPVTVQPTTVQSTQPLVAPFWSSMIRDGSGTFCNGGDSDVTWANGTTSRKVDSMVRRSSAPGATTFVTLNYITVTWRGMRYGGSANTSCSDRMNFQLIFARASEPADPSTYVIFQVGRPTEPPRCLHCAQVHM